MGNLFNRFARIRPSGRHWFSMVLMLVVVSMLFAPMGQPVAQATFAPASAVSKPAVQAPEPLQPYMVRVAPPSVMVVDNASADKLIAEAYQRQIDEVAKTLEELAARGLVGTRTFDDREKAFRAELSASARDNLSANPLIKAIQPLTTIDASQSGSSAAIQPMTPYPASIGIQDVSSLVFVQVYSPFMWGVTSNGGLSVTLTLEDAVGTVKGVASQTYNASLNYNVKIDPTKLYFETIFVDPNDPTHPWVMINPGDKVHVITAGLDTTGTPGLSDKRIIVDDVRAWASYEQDSVSGSTSPNASMVVTAGGLSADSYLTPIGATTYAETTAGSDGRFYVPTFRTANDPTYKKIGLQQGSTGFVRVRHSDGNEVYTIYGQNVFVLENSTRFHGYAPWLPSSQGGLASGVALARPSASLVAVLKNSLGAIKDTYTRTSVPSGYWADFGVPINGQDTIEVSVSRGLTNTIAALPVTARVDLGANQLFGTGPAGTQMVLAAGNILGYVAASSTYSYIQKRVTTDGGGNYSSGSVQCGTSNYLSLRPGSFGYAGFEDSRGNFVYTAYASAANYVMSGYPFIEGWIADGSVRPHVTVRDAGGGIKYDGTAAPGMFRLSGAELYLNVYYVLTPSQFVVPGDTVTVNSGGQTYTIPVDNITAYVDTDSNIVTGAAPPGANVRVVPDNDRSAYRAVATSSGGTYSAGNPFSSYNSGTCSESTKSEDFTPGAAGRAYIRHSDGSEVFAVYGRSMHINENEDAVDLYPFVWRNLDWFGIAPARPVTVTLTHDQAVVSTVQINSASGGQGLTHIHFKDSQGQRVLIRGGDAISANFDEGPNGNVRGVALTMNPVPRITAIPDSDADTLRGLGPIGWGGRAILTAPSTIAGTAKPTAIAPSSYGAYSPLRFLNLANQQIGLDFGVAGNVSFSDTTGNRVWIAWAVASIQVRISGFLRPGDTKVCGTAPPNAPVIIYDVTSGAQDIIIGTGSSDGTGKFCVNVSPPLYKGQVIMAESQGTLSQPVVVGEFFQVFLPAIMKN